ncbi:hypothetical protein COBT_001744 [Conglomerata obtusa]
MNIYGKITYLVCFYNGSIRNEQVQNEDTALSKNSPLDNDDETKIDNSISNNKIPDNDNHDMNTYSNQNTPNRQTNGVNSGIDNMPQQITPVTQDYTIELKVVDKNDISESKNDKGVDKLNDKESNESDGKKKEKKTKTKKKSNKSNLIIEAKINELSGEINTESFKRLVRKTTLAKINSLSTPGFIFVCFGIKPSAENLPLPNEKLEPKKNDIILINYRKDHLFIVNKNNDIIFQDLIDYASAKKFIDNLSRLVKKK